MKPNYDPVSGWAFETATPLGGVCGKRVDEAIADITTQNPAIAAHIPRFIVGCFWKPADAVFAFNNYDPTRFAKPEGEFPLNDDQLNQILWNEQARTNFYVYAWMNYTAQDRDTFLPNMYRGEKGRAGFPLYAPDTSGGSFLPGTSIQPLSPTEAAVRSVMFPHPMPFSLVPGQLGHMVPEPNAHAMAVDHFLCDVWFDLTTDVNVARYIRNWAISFGVNIAPEPTP